MADEYVPHHLWPLLLSLNLRHPPHQIANLIAIEASDLGDPVDIPNQVFCGPEKRPDLNLAFAATDHMAVRRDEDLDQAGRSPVLAQKAAEDRPKMVADLDLPQLTGGVLANLVGLPLIWVLQCCLVRLADFWV